MVRGVDDVMPDSVRNVYSSLRDFVDRSGFPPLFGDLSSPRIVDVQPRIRARENVTGRDIYGDVVVLRQIYAVRSLVRSGNSGGPLLATDGTVLGMTFAAALDSSDTGFALTASEIAADATLGRTATARVDTGSCTP